MGIKLLKWSCLFLPVLLEAFVPDTITAYKITPPRLFHIVPKSISADSVAALSCIIDPGTAPLQGIKIFLRTDQENFTKEIPLTYHQGAYRIELIPEMLQGKYLYYFFLAEFSDGRVIALPSENPITRPYKVPIRTTRK